MVSVMRAKKIRRMRRREWQSRMSLLGVAVVVISLGVVIFLQNLKMDDKIEELIAEEERLMQLIIEEQNRALELEELRVYMQTDQYYIKVAKEKLGLVRPNEVLIKPRE